MLHASCLTPYSAFLVRCTRDGRRGCDGAFLHLRDKHARIRARFDGPSVKRREASWYSDRGHDPRLSDGSKVGSSWEIPATTCKMMSCSTIESSCLHMPSLSSGGQRLLDIFRDLAREQRHFAIAANLPGQGQYSCFCGD